MTDAITHLEKTIAGEVPPITHLEMVIAEHSGGSGFTPTEQQLTAMNSGITSTDVEQITTNKNNILSKQDTLVVGTNLDDEPIEDSTNPITSGGVFDTVGNIDAALDSLIMSLEPKTITANGVYDPTDDGVDGYSEVTVNVPTGGSMYDDVVFYDYDGSVVTSYSATDFANLTAMPANPTHEGLTAQGWNWSLADAKAYVASYGKLNIGQMYITSDGKTRLYLNVAKDLLSQGVTLYLDLAPDTELDIDWGDGSEHTRWSNDDAAYGTNPDHTYTSAGKYVVAIEVITGEFYFSQGIYNIYEVKIGNGITSIGYGAFQSCQLLSSVTIPNSVTSIESSSFYDCFLLSSVTIPNSVTSIGGNAFQNCYALSSVTIPDSVTSVGDSAFENCYALSSITIPDSVTSVGYGRFQNCYALSSATISGTSISNADLGSCYALSSVTISGTSIGGNAFQNCYALSSVTILDDVTSIGDSAFSYCHLLPSVTIPDSVTSIGNNVFSDCYALSSITFESATPPVLGGDLGIPSTCIIRVPQGSLSAYTSASNYPSPSYYIYEEY